MKKSACFLLILTAMLAACGETAAPSSDTTAAPDTTTAAPETELLPDLPDKTYDGKTFTAYIRDDNYRRESFTVEEATGDVLNDAIFDRTRNVEERFGIDIKTHITSGDSLGNNSKSAILAGDDEYQLISAFFRTSITFASEELCYDWNELPYVDLSKPWWDGELQDTIALGSKRFIMMDTLTHDSLGATKSLLFVKHFFDTHKVDYPYDLVRDGKWTFDKMAEYIRMFAQDVNGDTKMELADDYFGYIGQWWQQPMNILATADQYIAEINDSGELALTLNSPRTVEVYEAFFKLVDEDAYFMNPDENYTDMNNAFHAGRGAFTEATLYSASTRRDMTADFGIIPPPKFDESVDGYHTLIDGSCNGLIVPVTVSDPEFVSAVLEALCYENNRTVIPAYYDRVLQGKIARDEDSLEMLDIIRAARTCDAGYMYLASISGGGAFADIGQQLTQYPDHNFSSYYAIYEESVLEIVKQINELYQ
ncbi:MAG: hypothetical protein IJF67_08900 [Clostridia bacterium]|nr:hypothetical protein [Clostridia bacterium]